LVKNGKITIAAWSRWLCFTGSIVIPA